jgi:hypothetical protein
MADFLIIQHQNRNLRSGRPSPQQLQDLIPTWRYWYQVIAATNIFSEAGKQPDCEGILVCAETSGGKFDPETIELIGGLTFIQAANYEEAVAIAQNCPILKLGGTVEIRQLYLTEDR